MAAVGAAGLFMLPTRCVESRLRALLLGPSRKVITNPCPSQNNAHNPQGGAFLRSRDPLVLSLSGEMAAQEREARRMAEAAAAAQAAAAALESQRSAVQAEEQRLFRALQDVRKVWWRWCGGNGGAGCLG